MRKANLIVLIVLFGTITWTLGRNLDPRSHNAKIHWNDSCIDGVPVKSGPAIEVKTGCKVTDITEEWIPKLNINFREIATSLTYAFNTFRNDHGSEPLHVKIEELEIPTSSKTLSTKTEKIISIYYSRLTTLAAYLTVFSSSTHLSEAIEGIRRALCNMKTLAKRLALNERNIIPKNSNLPHSFQTKSDTELLNLNETVLIKGLEILNNLNENFKSYVNSSLINCELKCHKKRKLVCKTEGQKKEKGKGKGKKHRSKKQRENRKGKGKNKSS